VTLSHLCTSSPFFGWNPLSELTPARSRLRKIVDPGAPRLAKHSRRNWTPIATEARRKAAKERRELCEAQKWMEERLLLDDDHAVVTLFCFCLCDSPNF
jgi:hypothetical protein